MSIAKNSALTIGARAIEAFIAIFSSIILARLLDPSEFGTFAIVLATSGLFSGFLDVGLTAAYIKTEEVTEDLKNSFFTLNILLGIISFFILLISAPIIGIIYSNTELMYLMFVFSFSVLITSISMQGVAQLTRKKEFIKLIKINFLTTVIAILLTLIVAFLGGGVWTFIVGALSRAIILTGLVIYYTGWKYKLAKLIEIKQYTKELKFTYQIFIGRMLNGMFFSIDKLLLGYSLDSNILGQYRNSQQYSRMTDTQIRMPIGTVIYSYIERYTGSQKQSSYYKFSIITILILTMVNGLLFLKGEILFLFVFGEKWSLAAEYIRYFSLFTMAISLRGIYITIAMAEDQLRTLNIFTALSIVLLLINIFILYIFNISILFFVQLYSVSIFIMWGAILSLKLFSFSKKNQFLTYFLASLFIVGICDIANHIFNLEILNSFLFVIILFELLMSLLLFYYLKIGIKANNGRIIDK